MSVNIYLGTQGWSYKSWVGSFFPPGTPASAFLSEYARRFHAVEVDSTFYGTPRATTVRAWAESTPDEFRFSAKIPRLITHDKKLHEVEGDLALFLETMSLLGDKLGPLIFQFPYQFAPTQRADLETLLAGLPSAFRFAIEVRHRGWLQPWFFDLLTQHRVALALADYAYMPKLAHATTDFTYIRWLGNRKDVPDDEYDHVRFPRSQDLDRWAEVVADLHSQDVTVWGFANNHYMGHSPATVRELGQRLSARGILP